MFSYFVMLRIQNMHPHDSNYQTIRLTSFYFDLSSMALCEIAKLIMVQSLLLISLLHHLSSNPIKCILQTCICYARETLDVTAPSVFVS